MWSFILYPIALVLLYIGFIVVKELISLYRTKFYVAQGFQKMYIPFIGVFGTLAATKDKPQDGVALLKEKVQEAQNNNIPGIVFNHQRDNAALILLTDLKLIREFFLKEIEVSHRKSLIEPPMYIPFFWENTEEALYKRTIFAEFFRAENLTRCIGDVAEVAQKNIAILREKILSSEKKEIDIDMNQEMVRWIQEIAETTILSNKEQRLTVDGKPVASVLYEALQRINSVDGGFHIANLLTFGVAGNLGLIPALREGMKLYRSAEKVVFQAYREREKVPTEQLTTTILDVMIRHNRGNPKYLLTEKDAIGYMITFIFAGVDTASRFMQNSMYCLAKNVDLQKKIREEVKQYDLTRPGINFEDLDKSEGLNGLYKETLRVFTPAQSNFERKLMKDFTLGPYHFRKGDFISIQLVGFMNSTQCTEDPDTFDASRFSKSAPTNKKVNTQSFIPFSLGKRNCVGQLLAEMLFKVTFANFVSGLEVTIPLNDNTHVWRSNPLYSIDHLDVQLRIC